MDLVALSSWASLISLGVSLVSLYMIKRVKSALIAVKREARIKNVLDAVLKIPENAIPLVSKHKGLLGSLDNNLPLIGLVFWTDRNRSLRKIKRIIEKVDNLQEPDVILLKHLVRDYRSSFMENV